MLIAKMLPLGTVFAPNNLNPGWEDMKLIITGYFSYASGSGTDYDYVVTPWPLGAINLRNGKQLRFCGCNEDIVDKVEFLGAISEESCEWLSNEVQRAIEKSDMLSPIAQGKESIAVSLGPFSDTIQENGYLDGSLLPLGSVISSSSYPGRKVMIIQHSGQDESTGMRHDYCVCPWPEGANPGDKYLYTLNHGEITAVHFRGYENAVSQQLKKQLEKKRRGSLFSRIIGKVSEW